MPVTNIAKYMPLRTEVEKALDELIAEEEAFKFQGLAVVLAKQKWFSVTLISPIG